MTIITHDQEIACSCIPGNSQIGVVGIPDSDEKEINLILDIYQLDETPIAIQYTE